MATNYNSNPSYTGQVNNAGDLLARHRDQLAGFIELAYHNATKAADFFTKVPNNKKGKSVTVPIVGTTGAQYIDAGVEMLGTNKVPINDVTIFIDKILESDIFCADDDEAMAERTFRQEKGTEMGHALAQMEDKQCLIQGVKSARGSAQVVGDIGGSVISEANMDADSSVVASAIYQAAKIIEDKNLARSMFRAFITPLTYFSLAENKDAINSLWKGLGSYAEGEIIKIAGIRLEMTNNLPKGVLTNPTGARNDYSGDFTNTVALIAHPKAVGIARLMSVQTRVVSQPHRNGALLIARQMQGVGELFHKYAIELAKPAPVET
jgi:hypothetical protein